MIKCNITNNRANGHDVPCCDEGMMHSAVFLPKTFNVDLIMRKQPDKSAGHLALQLAWPLHKHQQVQHPPSQPTVAFHPEKGYETVVH